MNKIPNDISLYVEPLISKDFADVTEIANRMVSMDIGTLAELRALIIKLAGYMFFAGSLAGYYSGQRRKVQYETILHAEGTTVDKEAEGKYAAADDRKKEEIFNNMFRSLENMIDALKKCYEIKCTEMDKSRHQEG